MNLLTNTSILGFFSGQDLLVLFVLFFIAAFIFIIIAIVALLRKGSKTPATDAQVILLNEILQELKKLNNNK